MTEITRQWLLEANKKYHEGNPICTDDEFDLRLEIYKSLHPDDIKIDSLLLGSSDRKQKLPVPMKSLDKHKDINEIIDWLGNEEFVLTPKLDGSSILIEVKNHKIIGAWTRGDGEYGQNILNHIKVMNIGFIASNVSDGFYIGEGIMRKSIFISKEYNKKYANPRNLVAGILNRKDITSDLKDIEFIPYIYLSQYPFSKFQVLKHLENSFTNIIPHFIYKSGKLTKELILETKTLLNNIDYEIDGVVIDINSYSSRNERGIAANGNPEFTKAIKLPEWRTIATVKVRDIELSVSKQGIITPVLCIDPVILSGASISKITAHNFKYLYDHKICPGSLIEITRSGEVIPKHIITIDAPDDYFSILDTHFSNCPSCGERIYWDENHVEKICANPDCKEKQIKKLVHFFTTLGVEFLGESSILKIFKAGYISEFQILNLTVSELSSIDGFSRITALKLKSEFDKILGKKQLLSKMAYALDSFEGIMGEKLCQDILNDFQNIEELIEFLESPILLRSKILKINGVSEITANSFISGMNSCLSKIDISHYLIKEEVKSNILKDIKVCFTGFRDSALENFIFENGGLVVSGVSKNTTHLVAKAVDSSSSKVIKAKNLGIFILTVTEFKTLINFK